MTTVRANSTSIEQYLEAKQRARRGDVLIRLGTVAGGVLLLIVAGMLMRPIDAIRSEAQLSLDPESLQGLPPDVVLLTKTGTLRGLAINMTFIRLEELKQENRFYELMQLSDWLCKLAPRYPSVWSYSAWNMAYNISVTQYTPEARWMWVSNGIENLRQRGLKYNPRSITLYKELAYIFWHKIGDKLDDQHMAYKVELAVQMERILGEPPLDLTAADMMDWIRPIAEAPADLEGFIAGDAEVKALLAALDAEGIKPDETLLHFVARHMRTYSSVEGLTAEESRSSQPDHRQRVQSILRDPAHAGAYGRLVPAVRSQVVREKLNMDPEFMLRLMEDPPWLTEARELYIERFGPDSAICPIDWRSPFAHALYWGTYGDYHTRGTLNINPNDSMNAVRFIMFALENMAMAGQLVLEPDFDRPNRSFLEMLPDYRFIKHMHAAYLKYGREQFADDPEFIPGTAGPNYISGHRNFLMRSIQQLFLDGSPEHVEEAKDYYFYLRETDREPDGSMKARYDMPFEKFALGDIYDSLETQAAANAFVSGLLYRHLRDIADGDVAAARQHFGWAQYWWQFYMRDVGTDQTKRRALEPIGVIRRDVVRDYIGSGFNTPLQKHRVWKALDLPTRQAVYDIVLPRVKLVCEQSDPPMDVDKVLPMPPGMEEFRANPNPILKQLERIDENVATGEKMSPD